MYLLIIKNCNEIFSYGQGIPTIPSTQIIASDRLASGKAHLNKCVHFLVWLLNALTPGMTYLGVVLKMMRTGKRKKKIETNWKKEKNGKKIRKKEIKRKQK